MNFNEVWVNLNDCKKKISIFDIENEQKKMFKPRSIIRNEGSLMDL